MGTNTRFLGAGSSVVFNQTRSTQNFLPRFSRIEIIINKSMKYTLSLCLIAAVIGGVLLYLHWHNIGDSNAQQESTPAENEETYEGVYAPELGVGEITLEKDGETFSIIGQTILAGPGNSANTEAMALKTGRLSGFISIENGSAVYIDPVNQACVLNFSFNELQLEISGGRDCHVTISNFSGKWYRE